MTHTTVTIRESNRNIGPFILRKKLAVGEIDISAVEECVTDLCVGPIYRTIVMTPKVQRVCDEFMRLFQK